MGGGFRGPPQSPKGEVDCGFLKNLTPNPSPEGRGGQLQLSTKI